MLAHPMQVTLAAPWRHCSHLSRTSTVEQPAARPLAACGRYVGAHGITPTLTALLASRLCSQPVPCRLPRSLHGSARSRAPAPCCVHDLATPSAQRPVGASGPSTSPLAQAARRQNFHRVRAHRIRWCLHESSREVPPCLRDRRSAARLLRVFRPRLEGDVAR